MNALQGINLPRLLCYVIERKRVIRINLCRFIFFLCLDDYVCCSMYRCAHGVLSNCYPGNVLMPFEGSLPFQLASHFTSQPVRTLSKTASARLKTTSNKCNCHKDCATKIKMPVQKCWSRLLKPLPSEPFWLL